MILPSPSSQTFTFPNAVMMTQYLSNHPSLKIDYYEENGITKAIAELAAKRFADRDIVEMDVELGTRVLICDLQAGKDRLTGKALPNLGELELPLIIWAQISMATKQALIDCANSFYIRKGGISRL